MASRASSDLAGRIPPLPRLGTSWYARGTGYWARRVGYVLLLALMMAGVCALSVALFQGFEGAAIPVGARPACDVVEGVLAAVAVVWGWIVGRRKNREECERARESKASWNAYRDHQRRAPGLMSAGRLLILIAAPVLPAVMAWATANVFALVLVAETPAEVGARRELAAKGLPAYPEGAAGGG